MLTLIRALMLTVLLAAWAGAATDVVPLKYTEGAGNDVPDSVAVQVFYGTDTVATDTVTLTRLSEDPNTEGIWVDSLTLTLGEFYTFVYLAFYQTDGDTLRVTTSYMLEDPDDYKGGTGGGAKSVGIFAIDTSGTNTRINGVRQSLWWHLTGTLIGTQTTADSGIAWWSLDAGDSVRVNQTSNGYLFSACTLLVPVGAGPDLDSCLGYDVAITPSGNPDVCTIAGTLVDLAGDAIADAKIYIDYEPGGAGADSTIIDSVNNVVIAAYGRYARTESDGTWTLNRIYSSAMIPGGVYRYRAVKEGILPASGAGARITVPDNATARIEDLILTDDD